ncbi:MAG: sensor histidine kinase [Bdellovibrionota bacterium]
MSITLADSVLGVRLKTIFILTAILGFSIVLTAGTALDLVTTEMHHGLQQHERTWLSALSAEKLKWKLEEQDRLNTLWGLSHDRKLLARRNQVRTEVREILAALLRSETDEGDRKLLLEAERPARTSIAAKVRIAGLLSQAETALDRYSTAKATEISTILARSTRYEQLSDWVARCAETLALILFVGMIWLFHRQIISPVSKMLGTIVDYKKGRRGARVPLGGLRTSEIRESAEAFNELADWINELERRNLIHLVGTVHDLRNPLTALKTVTALLGMPGHQMQSESDRKLIDLMRDQINRMTRLIDEWIDIQQVRSGRFKLRLQNVDLISIVSEVIGHWQGVSSGHQIFLLANPGEVIVARCDPTRIRQAVDHLLGNAIKYSPNGGSVQVVVQTEGDRATIRVKDQGLGISREDQPRIFEPFMRASAVRDVIPGTGMGLSNAKTIIEAHQGTIDFESTPGVGSTFSIHLPLAEQVKLTA